MPSHCDCSGDCTRYVHKNVDVSDKEYEKVRQVIKNLRSEERKGKRISKLESSLNELGSSIEEKKIQIKDLRTQYKNLSKEYNNKYKNDSSP